MPGSLKTDLRELTENMSCLVEVQEVGWDKGSREPTDE
jgi:hypothetical protein